MVWGKATCSAYPHCCCRSAAESRGKFERIHVPPFLPSSPPPPHPGRGAKGLKETKQPPRSLCTSISLTILRNITVLLWMWCIGLSGSWCNCPGSLYTTAVCAAPCSCHRSDQWLAKAAQQVHRIAGLPASFAQQKFCLSLLI